LAKSCRRQQTAFTIEKLDRSKTQNPTNWLGFEKNEPGKQIYVELSYNQHVDLILKKMGLKD